MLLNNIVAQKGICVGGICPSPPKKKKKKKKTLLLSIRG